MPSIKHITYSLIILLVIILLFAYTNTNRKKAEKLNLIYDASAVKLADKLYSKLANNIPCKRIVYEYDQSPINSGINKKVDPLDTCSDVFSVESTLSVQEWLYKHQHPVDCSKQRFAVINNYANSGLGSTIHQIVWAIAKALADNRIFVYATPGNWMWADCEMKNPDCFFLPVTNCNSVHKVDRDRVIEINANIGHWGTPIIPVPFSNQTFNWWRSQLVRYMLRFNKRMIEHVERISRQVFHQSLEHARPLITVYIRRSDKVTSGEMAKSYTLQDYFEQFDSDARRTAVRNLYLNSEDVNVFDEFHKNPHYSHYYRLFYLNQTRGITFPGWRRESPERQSQITLTFLTDLYIEANADMHVGTLSSNWCRLVDELRLSAGKAIPFYTPERRYFQDA